MGLCEDHLVRVGTPTLNGKEFLAECIEDEGLR